MPEAGTGDRIDGKRNYFFWSEGKKTYTYSLPALWKSFLSHEKETL
jgi:hypothetical protein